MPLSGRISRTLLLWATLLAMGAARAWATVVVTGATGGTSLSADTAANASVPAWTTLGVITIGEGKKQDFSAGNGVTLVLKAPAGFQFNLAALPSVTFTAGADLTSATVTGTDASTLTITLTVSGTGSFDTLRVGSSAGLQVRPTAGTPLASGRHIYRPSSGGGTASISGISTSADGSSGSNFGNLTEIVGAPAMVLVETSASGSGVILPAQNVAAGSSVTGYAIARDAFGNFVSNLAANVGGWSLVNTSGGLLNSDLVPATDRKSAVFTGHLVGSAAIRAISGALNSTNSGAITVIPGAATKLAVATQPSPTAVVAVPFAQQPVIRIEDAFGNLRSTDTLTVTAVRSGGIGTLLGTTSMAAAGGLATFTNLAHLAASDIALTFASGSLTSATSQTLSVSPGPFSQLQVLLPGETATPGVSPGKSGTPTPQATAVAFTLQVIATDPGWNPINTVTDTVAITCSDSAALLPPNAALINGSGLFTVTLQTSGSQTVTATDLTTGSQSGTSSPVTAYAFSKLQLLLPGETAAPGTISGKTGTPLNQTAGAVYSVTVNAVDANWNLVSTNDTVAITSSDTNATLPASAALVNGTRTFSLTNKTAGTWALTALDSTHPGITAGTSASFTVDPGVFARLQLLMPGETAAPGSASGKSGTPGARTAGTAFTVTVNGVDANWNRVTSLTGSAYTIQITSSDVNATLPANADLSAGLRTFSVTCKTSGSATVTASDVDDATKTPSTSPSTTVNPGAFTKLQLLVPGEAASPGSASGKTGVPSTQATSAPFTVAVRAVDANWNLISTNDRVHLTSSDTKAVLPADAAMVAGIRNASVTFMTAGTATITAANTTHTGIASSTSPAIPVSGGFTTNTINFGYANRSALLADGWTFWATNNGVGRNTEITNLADGAMVIYNPPDSPGVLRIPDDVGSIRFSPNTSRNSLFRNLSTNWVSMRLQCSFAPYQDHQVCNLAVYEDDDHFVWLGHQFSGNERVRFEREFQGGFLEDYEVSFYQLTATNMTLRMDRDVETDRISAFFSLDGATWIPVGTFCQGFVQPRLGILVTGSPSGYPNCDLIRLEVVTRDTTVTPALAVQPQRLVFNTVAGQPCTNLQALNVVLRNWQYAPVHWALSNSAPAWVSTSASAGDTPGTCDVSVNAASLAPGTYEALLTCSAPGAASAATRVTLIVNPSSRARVATWQGGKSGALSVSVDDSRASGFDELRTNGFAGTYLMWQETPPDFFASYYQSGMELGSHTLSHPCFELPPPTLRGEMEGNVAGLLSRIPVPPSQVISFSWPCGTPTIAGEVVAADYFLLARGFNFNQLEDATPHDFMNLKSFNSHGIAPLPPADFKTVVDDAIAQGKWFNLVLHALSDTDGAVAYSVGKSIWVAPMGSVTKYIVQRDRAVITNYVENSSTIQFGCYRLPLNASSMRSFETALTTNDVLTFRVDTSGLSQVSGVFVNGLQTPFSNSGGVLYFNALVTTNTQTVILDLRPNTAPTLPAQIARAVNELTTLTVTNTATDTNFPAQALTYTLAVAATNIGGGLQAPGGGVQTNAVIDASGVILWTPTEAQGPGTYSFTTVVTDGATPPLSATNSFIVTVSEVNVAPVLPARPNLTVYGSAPLTIFNAATDADLPLNLLSYQLLAAPANAAIDPNGAITWTPPETAVPSTNTFTTVVTDTSLAVNALHLSATNTFTVTAIPNPLRLPAQTNLTLSGLTTLVVTNTATLLTNLLSSSWLQTNTTAFDYPDRAALLADGWSFWATNNGSGRNTEPAGTNLAVAYAQTNASLGRVMRVPCGLGDLWSALSNTTTNSIFRSLPANWVSACLNLGFQPTGDYQQAHLMLYQDDDNYVEVGMDYSGGTKFVFVQEALGQPSLLTAVGTTATTAVLRLDRDINTGYISAFFSLDNTNWTALGQTAQSLLAPRLGIWTGGSVQPFSSTGVVCDLQRLDLVELKSTDPLTYQLAVTNLANNTAVTGAAIDANGMITWTPTAANGPGTYLFTSTVVDNRVPPLFATNSFMVTLLGTAAPSILSVVPSSGAGTVITWSAFSNRTYRVQSKTNLTSAGWTDLSPDTTATGSTASFTNSPVDARPRFYRVALLP